MKKVLHIRSSGEFLGAENVVLQLSNFSKEFDFEPHILVIQDARDDYPLLAKYAKEQGTPCTVITTQKRIDLKSVAQLKKVIKDEKIDIINTHGYKENIYAFLAFSGMPIIATNHLWKKTNRMLRLYAFIDSILLTRFKKIIAVSEAIFDEMKAISYLKNTDMTVISNGIDYEAFNKEPPNQLRSSLNIPEEDCLLLTVSSLTPEKGHKFLIDALATSSIINKRWHLVVVGGGREQASIEKQIDNLSLNSRISLIGYRQDIADLLAISDLYLLPSLDEGLPMALLEAMAAKKACIATDVGDVAKVIRNDNIGKLVTPGSSAALANALESALSNPAWREKAGKNARQLIKDEFSSRSMTKNYTHCYNEVLNTHE